ncbi:hypothetical protein ALC62_10873 [Cyphomyrmex costatus]|uniref:Uncharacterized protein n=1 Tax=Cyphomyrmex costatus TaxID=456900 RepID=A0A151IDD2_9HYME|nr:hypothetical protein ALC62_10873 [Cyphomyrmex costatus]
MQNALSGVHFRAFEEVRKDWLTMKRNPTLVIRIPGLPTLLSRATSFNRTNVSEFFDKYKSVLDKHNYTSSRIWNANETGITTVCTIKLYISMFLPRLQPLDEGVYRQFKNYMSKYQTAWMHNNPNKIMTIYDLPGIVKDSLPLTFNSSKIMSGFRKSSI